MLRVSWSLCKRKQFAQLVDVRDNKCTPTSRKREITWRPWEVTQRWFYTFWWGIPTWSGVKVQTDHWVKGLESCNIKKTQDLWKNWESWGQAIKGSYIYTYFFLTKKIIIIKCYPWNLVVSYHASMFLYINKICWKFEIWNFWEPINVQDFKKITQTNSDLRTYTQTLWL